MAVNTPKTWLDYPGSTATPITGASLSDLENRSIRPYLDARYWVGFTSSASDKGPQLQTALDAARDEGPGARLILPPWMVVTAQQLIYYSGVHIRGHGPGTSGIKLANTSNTTVLHPFNEGTTGVIDASFQDFTIDGNKANNASGARGLVIDSDRINVTNVVIHDCKTDGIRIRHSNTGADSTNGATGGFDHNLVGVRVANCAGNGFLIEAHDANLVACQAIQCGTRAAGTAGFNVAALAYLEKCHAWWYDSSGTNNGDYGTKVQSGSAGSTFVDCINEGAHLAQVFVDANVCFFTSGSVFPAASDPNVCGFEIGANSSSCTFRDVWVHDTGTGGGWKFTGSGAATVLASRFFDPGSSKPAITGSPDITVDYSKLLIGGSGTLGTAIVSIASAGTITVPPGDGSVAVTGTTPINFINSASKIGGRITLVFSVGGGQVQPGSFIKLNGSGNYNPTAGSSLSLVYTGSSVWTETGRAIL